MMNERNYAIDLLRVWCMFFIVAGHFSPSFLLSEKSLSLNVLGTGAVDLFVLITGFFGIRKESVIRHYLSIYFAVVFYNFLMTALFYVFTAKATELDFIRALWPLGCHKMGYWFVTKYLGLLLLAPFINLLIERMNGRTFFLFWCVLIFLNTTWFAGFPPGNLYGGPWTLMWFFCLYVTGRGIHALCALEKISRNKNFWLALVLFGYVMMLFLWRRNWHWMDLGYNSLPVFFVACVVFFLVTTLRWKSGKLFSWITHSVFAVYLIHSQFFFYSYLQSVLADFFLKYLGNAMLAWMAMSSTVFVGCVVFDQIRLCLFQVLRINSLIDFISRLCTEKILLWIRA